MRTTRVDRRDIERAMKMTKSNLAASKYIGMTLTNYKAQAKKYFNESGESLYDLHKNQSGTGVRKHSKKNPSEDNLIDILEGRAAIHFVWPKSMKDRLIKEGFFEQCCSKCGYKDYRAVDKKSPLILNFKDFNKRNFLLENLEILCYNCYFINVGEMFEQHQTNLLEDFRETKKGREIAQLDIPVQHKDLVEKTLNLTNKKMSGDITPEDEDYGSDLISYNTYKK